MAAKQAWKAYLATLLEQIQSDEPLAGGKQRGQWKASIESYTQISAAIHRVSAEYYYELFVYGKVVEKSSACTDRKRICAQAVQAWKDKFAKDLADV